VTYSTSGYTIN